MTKKKFEPETPRVPDQVPGVKRAKTARASAGFAKLPSPNQDSPQNSDKDTELVGRCLAEIHRSLGRNLPKLAFVLGSGFQRVLQGFRMLEEASYSALPGFRQPSVPGHSGTLLLAEIEGVRCLVCSGRVHFYEGHAMEAVMFPVNILAECGVKELVLTNAAGGINQNYRSGDFMILSDHINFTGVNPLRQAGIAPRFLDLTRAYSPSLRREFLASAAHARIRLHTGVYLGVSGPSYETPAEIRAFRTLGADAVGMSTIPEVLMARSRGLEVAAISCITNPAAGLRRKELSHEEVLTTGKESADRALRLFAEFARRRAKKGQADESAPEKNLKIGVRTLGSPFNKR